MATHVGTKIGALAPKAGSKGTGYAWSDIRNLDAFRRPGSYKKLPGGRLIMVALRTLGAAAASLTEPWMAWFSVPQGSLLNITTPTIHTFSMPCQSDLDFSWGDIPNLGNIFTRSSEEFPLPNSSTPYIFQPISGRNPLSYATAATGLGILYWPGNPLLAWGTCAWLRHLFGPGVPGRGCQ